MFNAGTGNGQSGNSIKPAVTQFNTIDTTNESDDPEDEYEETLITINVQRIGSLEIPAIIYGQKIYLSVNQLFDFLKIRNTVSPDLDLMQGFFVYPKDNYVIDKTNNRIVYGNKAFELDPTDMIRTETNLFL